MARLSQIVALLALIIAAVQTPASATGDAKHDVTGIWDFQTDVGGRKGTVQFVFQQKGNSIGGKQVGPQGEIEISGTLDGDKIEFRVATFGGKTVYKGIVANAERMSGEVNQVVSKGQWTAERGTLTAVSKPSEAPDKVAAERRVKEFAKLVDAGNVAEFKKYVAENFAPSFLEVPMERHIEFFGALREQTHGLEFQAVEESAPTSAAVQFKGKLVGNLVTLRARVEPNPPHRIVGMGAGGPRQTQRVSTAKRTDQQIHDEMQSLMTKLGDAGVFSGTVLLARDGVPLFQGAYGIANKDFDVPNRIDTKFNLGSMNKMFTAVAAAQLVERGKLSFDDPVSKFLPDFPDAESAKKIKIKHLLTHTAGLGGYFSKPWQDSSRALYRTVDDQMKRAAADEKLLFEPGTRHRYSNTGMLVVGKVIEIASGQDYYDYVRENIYAPAGMRSTDCYELDKVNPNLAIGYDKRFDESGVSFHNNIFQHVLRGGPQGGGYSTVEDLLKFDIALRSNKLVGPEYVKLLLSGKPELHSPNYGYGFAIDEQLRIAGHGGGFIGINSNLDMFLGTGWTAAVMSNYSQGARIPQQIMRELIQGQLDAAPASAK